MSEEFWVRVADEADFAAEPLRTVEFEGENVIVCRIAGKYFAVEDRCSHDGGILHEGTLAGVEITCPRHGARFDVTSGAALSMPAVTPVRTYPVKCEDGAVWVGIDL